MKESKKMVLGYVAGGMLVFGVFPTLIYLLSMLLDMIHQIELIENDSLRWVLFGLLLIVGLIWGIASVVALNVIGEGGPLEVSDIEISPRTKKLVVTGPYRYTRNPMLFGTSLIYTALAVFLNSFNAFLVVILFAVLMLKFVVKQEEKRLMKDFGSSYEQYRKKTPLLFPKLFRSKYWKN